MKFRKANRVWTWPLFLATTSMTGLLSALLTDGWGDAAAWVGLGIPVMVVIFCLLRAR
jgi:hypothetical protein